MRFLALGAGLVLVGCVGPASDGGEPPTAATATDSAPAISGPLRPGSGQPTRSDTLTGTLGADAVEGGCTYLETADDTRYEVIYPRGWRVTASPLQVTNPLGQVVARAGDEVTVRGSETTELASICQIGPIFQATSVEQP